ncbi:hypothetical protein FOA43_004193 [Brettanomyces nanus]|uniref:SWI/SNF complex subunit SWI3 n=1 Tax=Eeniella nana TaxID=13502 RepID=A0A875SB73_EENNA|nr:uncharacterized protein FOA43_004193 [Brettanomyces nanus]QPG76799.1 hypothetical protein FOA43_004193 [Brettanomyces nanus]
MDGDASKPTEEASSPVHEEIIKDASSISEVKQVSAEKSDDNSSDMEDEEEEAFKEVSEDPNEVSEELDEVSEQPDEVSEQPDEAEEQPDEAEEQPDEAEEQPDEAEEQISEPPSESKGTTNATSDNASSAHEESDNINTNDSNSSSANDSMVVQAPVIAANTNVASEIPLAKKAPLTSGTKPSEKEYIKALGNADGDIELPDTESENIKEEPSKVAVKVESKALESSALDTSRTSDKPFAEQPMKQNVSNESKANEETTPGTRSATEGPTTTTDSPMPDSAADTTAVSETSEPQASISMASLKKQTHTIVLPSYVSWFDLKQIHKIEKESLPEFFNKFNKNKSPEIYVRYRNFMINAYRLNPNDYLSFTAVRRNLVGDAATLLRVHRFLDKWGLINYQVNPETRPVPVEPPYTGDFSVDYDTPRGMFPFEGYRPPNELPDLSKVKELLDKQMGSAQTVSKSKEATPADDGEEPPKKKIKIVRPDIDNGWTEESLKRLTEGVAKFKADWYKVAEYVGQKTSEECIIRFLQLPIEDKFLEEHKEMLGPLKYIPNLSFSSNDNPVMSTLAFLCRMIDPEVAAAASTRAIKIMDEKIDEKINAGKPIGDKKVDDVLVDVEDAAVNSFGIVGARSHLFASYEEREMNKFSVNIIQNQLKIVELKLAKLNALEKEYEYQRKQLSTKNDELFLERLSLFKYTDSVSSKLMQAIDVLDSAMRVQKEEKKGISQSVVNGEASKDADSKNEEMPETSKPVKVEKELAEDLPISDLHARELGMTEETSVEAPAEAPAQQHSDEPADEPADEPTDQPADEPADEPTDEPTDQPAEKTDDGPAEKPDDEPVDDSEEKISEAESEHKESAVYEDEADKSKEVLKPIESTESTREKTTEESVKIAKTGTKGEKSADDVTMPKEENQEVDIAAPKRDEAASTKVDSDGDAFMEEEASSEAVTGLTDNLISLTSQELEKLKNLVHDARDVVLKPPRKQLNILETESPEEQSTNNEGEESTVKPVSFEAPQLYRYWSG